MLNTAHCVEWVMKYLIFIFWIFDTENTLKMWVGKSVSKSKIFLIFQINAL